MTHNNILHHLLDPVPLPLMVRIRQTFERSSLHDPAAQLEAELRMPGGIERIRPGQRVAIAVGSRGIANLPEVVRTVVREVRRVGAQPFIIPCMGSHGGATSEGQAEVLCHLGIVEDTVDAPIHSSMEVNQLDCLPNGLPVYADRLACEADAIIPINRVKPHTAFRGTVESGVMKMMAIGMGKQQGADAYHRLGFGQMAENVVLVGRILLRKLPIVFGVALVEDAYDETCMIRVLPGEHIEAMERELLLEAKRRMPQLPFSQLDVLVIDWFGKNISGSGMDPNVTGKFPTPFAQGGPEVTRLVALDLTAESGGNANGMGIADYSTQRMLDKIDFPSTYANGLTSTVTLSNKIPVIMTNDRYAIQAAIKTCNIFDFRQCRLVRIKDTLHVGELYISQSLLAEAAVLERVEILSAPQPFRFQQDGNLLPFGQR